MAKIIAHKDNYIIKLINNDKYHYNNDIIPK